MQRYRARPNLTLVTRDARIVHELEQMGAALADLAPVMARMRDLLIEEGYTRDEAVEGSFRVLETLLARDDLPRDGA